jgi:hypothetical protein
MSRLGESLRELLLRGWQALGPLRSVLAVLAIVLVIALLCYLTSVWLRSRVRKAPPTADAAAAKRVVSGPLTVLGAIVTVLGALTFFGAVGTGTLDRTELVPVPAPSEDAEEGAFSEPAPETPSEGASEAAPAVPLTGEDQVLLTNTPCVMWMQGDVAVEGTTYRDARSVIRSQVCGDASRSASAAYVLNRRFSRFTVRVGMLDTSKYAGPVGVEVFLDEDEARTVVTSQVRLGQPLEIDEDVTGAIRATVRITMPVDTPDIGVGLFEAQGVP